MNFVTVINLVFGAVSSTAGTNAAQPEPYAVL